MYDLRRQLASLVEKAGVNYDVDTQGFLPVCAALSSFIVICTNLTEKAGVTM